MSATGDLHARPRLGMVIVTCMDVRIDPLALLGLQPGDAHVLRNAGGLVTDDVLRSIAVSQAMLGTQAIRVIHHTQCGMRGTEEALAAAVAARVGRTVPLTLGAFTDVEEQARRSAKAIQDCPFLVDNGNVEVYVYDVDDRSVHQVV